jgi:hypothetical protein
MNNAAHREMSGVFIHLQELAAGCDLLIIACNWL